MRSIFKKIVVWILTLEARLVLLKYRPRVVGITGSVGKTSTKDAVYAVLSSAFYVRKSEKSFNSDIGVPLTILGCDNAWNNPFLWLANIFKGLGVVLLPNHYPAWLVLEVGLDRPGDIARVVKWLSCDVVVLTRLADTPVHVEFFESPQELRREKLLLAKALKKHGVLVVNNDDKYLVEAKHPDGGRRITYGLDKGADIVPEHIETLYERAGGREVPIGTTFKVAYRGSVVPVTVPNALGIQHVYPALAGIAVGLALDVNLVTIGQALARLSTPPARMRVLEGVNGSTLIDDSYNSSPVALAAALTTLEELKVSGRRLAVLGDMTELGKHTVDEHKKIGARAARILDMLVSVGPRAHYIAEGAREAGMRGVDILERQEAAEAGKEIAKLLEQGDVVLVKGSQSMRMERAVRELLAEPHRAAEILVRHDREWLNKE
ncbi:UDP-N-acetylmuramoyl-tripeptide--D-alanyl-D-alanine ligase [Candidatus Wolfebacteria bacterium]|nr:UDP-N-acetylmuramoyl-tripeptide--D-alanyl-D-alanine ligase [Candidatus Wolfebacteria bacterium]